MENEKKPSRFGVTLSAILIAVLLVVCMAVPAFAQGYGSYPSTLPELPSGDKEWLIWSDSGTDYLLIDVSGVDYVRYATFASETNGWYCYAGSMNSANRVSADIYTVVDGQWTFSKSDKLIDSSGTSSWGDNVVYSTKWVTVPSGNSQFFQLQSGGTYPEYRFTDVSGYGYFVVKSGSYYYCCRVSDPDSAYVSYDANGDPFVYVSAGTFERRTYSGATISSLFGWNTREYVFGKNIMYSSFVIRDSEGMQFYPPPPPPPDPYKPFSSGLTVVLEWVGATVSALFSGSLSGLLPLVAVPVAITLLLVAIIVIKRSIWGA